MASSTRSALMWNRAARHLAASACRPSAPRFHSTRTASSPVTWPSLPVKALVATAKSRSHAFLLRARGAQLHRPVGPGQQLVLVLGRLRQDFDLGDRARALAVRGADAVRAGIAAADHQHVACPVGQDVRARRPSRRRRGWFCCGRNSIAKWMPFRSRPGHRQVARRFRADRQHHGVVALHQPLDRAR